MNFTQCNLGSGIRLHLCETDKFKSITCKVFIQQDLDKEKASSTALIPLILRRGSQKFPSTLQIARELEYLYAADFSSDVLKIGERQILEFYFDMVDPALLPNGAQNAERGLGTFWDIITNPAGSGSRFVETYFSQEQQNLQQEVEGLVNNKRAYAMARAISEMFSDEPFGVYKYGDVEGINNLKNEAVFQHFQELLTTCPLDIFLVGPNLDVLANMFARFDLQRGKIQTLQPPVQKEVKEPRYITETMDVQQSILFMGYRTNHMYLNDNYYALLVGNGILGGFPHSKLFMNVRERASLAYYVGSSIEGTKGVLTITAGIDGTKVDQTINIIEQQLEDLQNGIVSEEELDQTKRGLITSITSMSDNPASIIDRSIIGIVNGQMRSIDYVTQAIERVTLDDVVRVMNKLTLDLVYVLQGKKEE